jgi:hypothetical protein
MTLIELKKSIHAKIDDVNDPDFLEMVNLLKNKGKVFEIPEVHLAGIEQGKKDMKNGDFFTMEEFEKKYEKWLKD